MSPEVQRATHKRNRSIYIGFVITFSLIDMMAGLLQISYSTFLLITNNFADVFSAFPYALLSSGTLALISFAFGLLNYCKTNFFIAMFVSTSNTSIYRL
nr:hypothetical transcript [Hymenolepis microstoma]